MVIERRGLSPVAAGRHPVDLDVVQPGGARQELELAGGEAGGPELELGFVALGPTHRRHLVQHPRRRVVLLPHLQVANGEDGRECTHREAAAPAEAGRDPAEHRGLVSSAQQAEAALAQADGGVEFARVVELPDVELLEGGRQPFGGRGRGASWTNAGLWSTPTTSTPRRASARE